MINNTTADQFIIKGGVFQDLFFGLLLFIMFVDLTSVVKLSTTTFEYR